MIVEIGRDYRTANGRKARATHFTGEFDRALGSVIAGYIDGYPTEWYRDCGMCTNAATSQFDLTSLWEDSPTCTCSPSRKLFCSRPCARWEDSPTQIKSESNMDVKVGDRVTVDAVVVDFNHVSVELDFTGPWVARDRIKSVEPAPPGVGDTVTWGLGQWTVLGVDGEAIWVKEIPSGSRVSSLMNSPGFRIIKRAGG